ncbi:hypothetical protein MKW94_010180 [Papaver nudicaule]|uniref:Uncharacterized protein n=1 Tax=Papaver nudicaule TaxID=74823 RepID=A0AA41S3Z6_PAPNU|nr:hypothetical protein [Papaver nudicaule]
MAATKTSLVLFLFALIAISAHLQMALAGLLQCDVDVAATIRIDGHCLTHLPSYCFEICEAKCPAVNLEVDTYLCVPGLISLTVDGCLCCYKLKI